MTTTELKNKNKKIFDTAANYSLTTDLHVEEGDRIKKNDSTVYDDQVFWWRFLADPEKMWDKPLKMFGTPVVSDWVARVPGLYWLAESANLRAIKEDLIESRSRGTRSPAWIQYTPDGKSRVVLGGIGTFRLPPADDGKRLMMISFSHNASAGIPALVYPDVIDKWKLSLGSLVEFAKPVYWRKMSADWIGKFDKDRNVPRGYLVIDKPNLIRKVRTGFPVEIHPFTIMEYQQGNSAGLLYDYAFMAIDNKVPKYKTEIETFFNSYKNEFGRAGKYLLAADSVEHLFDAEYQSPSELLAMNGEGKSQLNLLRRRILGDYKYKTYTISKLLKELPGIYKNTNAVGAFATRLGVQTSLLTGHSAAAMSASLIDYCDQRGKLDLLVDLMIEEE